MEDRVDETVFEYSNMRRPTNSGGQSGEPVAADAGQQQATTSHDNCS
jgi:hypothetical protein